MPGFTYYILYLSKNSGIWQISIKVLDSRTSSEGQDYSFGANEEKETTLFLPQEGKSNQRDAQEATSCLLLPSRLWVSFRTTAGFIPLKEFEWTLADTRFKLHAC